jgi:hypothetical protein
MRLKVSHATANERLIALVNRGYAVLNAITVDYANRKAAGTYDKTTDKLRYEQMGQTWANDEVIPGLEAIFPTELEINRFSHPEIPFGAVSGDYEYASYVRRLQYFIANLDKIRRTSLPEYTDLPIQNRLYIEDIDSFAKARDVNHAIVAPYLANGYLERSEDFVQLALEQIIGVSFHRKDWAGELNDLCTANVIVSGTRRATAFLLKGPGIGRKEMTIANCGKNGDQLVRLFSSPAELFVVQYVGPVADLLITDVEGKTSELRNKGRPAHYLIMDGQDTARVLHAYGKLGPS